MRRGLGRRHIWTFLRPREQIAQGDVQETTRGTVKQMFWAAFGFGTCTELIPLQGNGDAWQIRELYASILPAFLQPGAPVHTAYAVNRLLEDLGIKVMEWPPYSPDLNPIENLWALLRAKIHEMHLELLELPDNKETWLMLQVAAHEAWNEIRPEVLESLVEKMPKRIANIQRVGGWYTKY